MTFWNWDDVTMFENHRDVTGQKAGIENVS